MNNKKKELYGLVGFPVKHSYSAFMHNAAFGHYGMNAEYCLFEVAPEKLEEFFKKTILEKKIHGFNVTVPHKERALLYLNEISPEVKMIGAANTVLVEKNGLLRGFNTDGLGFSCDLGKLGVEIKNKTIALLGAGGGAKAIAMTLANLDPAKLLIFDIDHEKSKRLSENIKKYYPHVLVDVVSSADHLNMNQADVLVNATPIGMKEADPLLVKQEWLHKNLFVYDLIYNPSETKLLKMAKGAGCKCSNGLGMLLYQGCLAFEHWTGKQAPADVMRKALLERVYG